MFYELRTYRCSPGRIGDVVDRFARDVLPLWEKHGFDQIGFWTVVVGNSSHDVIYMLRWESAADRDAKWPQFATDPEWAQARERTERNGPLIETISNQLLAPTAFSTLQ